MAQDTSVVRAAGGNNIRLPNAPATLAVAKETGVAAARLWTRADYASLAKRGGKEIKEV